MKKSLNEQKHLAQRPKRKQSRDVIQISASQLLCARLYIFSMRDGLCSPLIGTDVASVLGEEPAVAVEIFDAILPLTIDGLVQFLYNSGACQLCSSVMCINVFDENGETLSSVPDLHRTRRALPGTGYHHISVAKIHLRSAYRFAVVIVLPEAKYSCEPVTSIRYALVDDVRKHGIRWNGTIFHGPIIIELSAPADNRICTEALHNLRIAVETGKHH